MMKKLLLFSSFIISLVSCTEKETITLDLNHDIKSFMDFKVGSYWIYKDSVSGKIDSCFVTEYINNYYYQKGRNICFSADPNMYLEQISYRLNFPNNNLRILLSAERVGVSAKYFDSNNTTHSLLPYYNTFSDTITYQEQIDSSACIIKWRIKRNVGFTKFQLADSSVHELLRYHVIQ